MMTWANWQLFCLQLPKESQKGQIVFWDAAGGGLVDTWSEGGGPQLLEARVSTSLILVADQLSLPGSIADLGEA
jgi:hypothetical protein